MRLIVGNNVIQSGFRVSTCGINFYPESQWLSPSPLHNFLLMCWGWMVKEGKREEGGVERIYISLHNVCGWSDLCWVCVTFAGKYFFGNASIFFINFSLLSLYFLPLSPTFSHFPPLHFQRRTLDITLTSSAGEPKTKH